MEDGVAVMQHELDVGACGVPEAGLWL
jgi:hypothetical protein